MLRFAYRCLLRLHPPYFRRRFSQEMLSIFDQEKGFLAVATLLADGILSLLRQWVLRPAFWEEPVPLAAPDGVPVFHLIEGFKPRPRALLDGGLVSVIVFTSICLMMGYSWNHPARGPVISVWRSGSHIYWRPPLSAPSPSDKEVAGERPMYVDGGRVVVMIQVPGRPRTPSNAR
ncbi:MAG: hypothetical protein WB952_10070 [Terriglobales bacterium]